MLLYDVVSHGRRGTSGSWLQQRSLQTAPAQHHLLCTCTSSPVIACRTSNSLKDQKRGMSPQTGSAQHAVGESMQAPSSAEPMHGGQHQKGYKVYYLSIFLFLFCSIKMAILLSHFLLDFSCRDAERALHHLPLSRTSLHSWGRILNNYRIIVFIKELLILGSKMGERECGGLSPDRSKAPTQVLTRSLPSRIEERIRHVKVRRKTPMG